MRRPEEEARADAPVKEPERAAARDAKKEEAPEEPPKSSRGKIAVLIVLAAFIVLLLVAGVVILTMFPRRAGTGRNPDGSFRRPLFLHRSDHGPHRLCPRRPAVRGGGSDREELF